MPHLNIKTNYDTHAEMKQPIDPNSEALTNY